MAKTQFPKEILFFFYPPPTSLKWLHSESVPSFFFFSSSSPLRPTQIYFHSSCISSVNSADVGPLDSKLGRSLIPSPASPRRETASRVLTPGSGNTAAGARAIRLGPLLVSAGNSPATRPATGVGAYGAGPEPRGPTETRSESRPVPDPPNPYRPPQAQSLGGSGEERGPDTSTSLHRSFPRSTNRARAIPRARTRVVVAIAESRT